LIWTLLDVEFYVSVISSIGVLSAD